MKKRIFALMMVALMLFSGGCAFGNSNVTQDTIIINKKGNISGVIVEDFDKEYYNGEELGQMIQEEIAA